MSIDLGCLNWNARHMEQVSFRRADPADVTLVSDLSRRAYVPAYMSVIGEVPKPATEDYAERIMDQNVWIALFNDAPVGVLVLERNPSYLLIYSIAVEPSHQRKGLGEALLGKAETLAVELKLPEMRLYTNSRMEKNLNLYRKVGFTEIGARPHPSRSGEFLVDLSKRI
jgi:ribosomal protein S18 acetylase RimI-like enzyme